VIKKKSLTGLSHCQGFDGYQLRIQITWLLVQRLEEPVRLPSFRQERLEQQQLGLQWQPEQRQQHRSMALQRSCSMAWQPLCGRGERLLACSRAWLQRLA
jgi:hypothetical protein